jgi:hypothetical protein
MSHKSRLSLIASAITILGLLPTVRQTEASLGAGMSLSISRGIVGTTVGVTLTLVPPGDPIDIRWDGQRIVAVTIDQSTSSGSGSFRIPAAIKGVHTVSARRGDTVIESKLIEVVPRIKIIPGMAGWGEKVDVSLRGYKPWTIVRIRWLRGSTWVEVARVSTSRTGSANIYVPVPSWAPVGPNSIRGDAVTAIGGRAQTNAFRADRLIYVGDPIESKVGTDRASQPASPTPTPTVEPTAQPTSTSTAESPQAATPVARAVD